MMADTTEGADELVRQYGRKSNVNYSVCIEDESCLVFKLSDESCDNDGAIYFVDEESDDGDVLHFNIADDETEIIMTNKNDMTDSSNCFEIQSNVKKYNCKSNSICYDSEGNAKLKNCSFDSDTKVKNKSCTDIGDSGGNCVAITENKNLISDFNSAPSVQTKKESRKKVYRCQIDTCMCSFIHLATFKQHQMLHSLNKCKCRFCEKVISNADRLKQHESLHLKGSGELNSFKCCLPECDKEFSSLRLLRRHEMGHREIVCFYCKRKFKTSVSYKKHIETHDTLTRYSCLECGKCFNYANKYYQHKLIHLLKRNYLCNICGREFYKSSNLMRHRLVHLSKKYVCNICRCSFTYLTTLSKHMVKFHPIAYRNRAKSQKVVINKLKRKLCTHFKFKRKLDLISKKRNTNNIQNASISE